MPEGKFRRAFSFAPTLLSANGRQKLEESEERLRTFIDSTKDMVFLKDDQFVSSSQTRPARICWAFARMTFWGKPILTFVPGESAVAGEARPYLEALATENGIIEAEDNFNGRIMKATKFRIDLGNGQVGLATVIRDVTEQRVAEEAVRERSGAFRTLSIVEGADLRHGCGGPKVVVWNKRARSRPWVSRRAHGRQGQL